MTIISLIAAIIDVSTIQCLRKNGFSDTADLLEIFSHWWRIVSVKTPRKGLMQRDEFSTPMENGDWKLDYLTKFLTFLTKWKSLCKSKERYCLTHPTFNAFFRTTEGIILICRHLLNNQKWDYVLTGSLVSDPIEKR